MKAKSLPFILAILLFSLLYSCSDNSTTPDNNTTKNYFPLSVGSYWIFAKYEVDTAGRLNETRRVDSFVITNIDNKSGKTAYKLKVFKGNGEDEDYYFYSENGALFVTGNYIMPTSSEFIEIPIDIKDRWIKLADTKNNSWTILDTNLVNAVANIPALGDVILNGKYTIKGEKGTIGNVNIGEPTTETKEAVEYKIIHNFTGTIKLGSLPAVNSNFTVTLKNYFADKIGFVKQTLIPSVINIVGIYNQYINGHDYVLLRYFIK